METRRLVYEAGTPIGPVHHAGDRVGGDRIARAVDFQTPTTSAEHQSVVDTDFGMHLDLKLSGQRVGFEGDRDPGVAVP